MNSYTTEAILDDDNTSCRFRERNYTVEDLELGPENASHTVPFAMEIHLLIFERDALTKGDHARSLMTMPRHVEMHKVLHFHIDTNMSAWKAGVLIQVCCWLNKMKIR